jgi:hypothetical protein
MIVAIEGASAAGKTTWCRSHFPESLVPEAAEDIAAPDLFANAAEVGQFWTNHAMENWQKALVREREHGLAVCDGDPFHLYFSWALWKSGTLDRHLFEIESALYRNAFEKRQIGFADHVLWLEVPDAELRRRAKADSTRRRKRHEIYLSLVPWMKKWFQARESILPGTLRPLLDGLCIEDLQPIAEAHRYNAAVMVRMLNHLNAENSAHEFLGFSR